MKRGLVAAGVAALLLLTGCTSTVTSETITVTPGASGTFSDGDTTVVVEPSGAPAAPVEVTSAPATEAPGDADQFLIKLQLAMANDGVKMTSAEIQSAADYACDQIAAGVGQSDIVALTGDVHAQTNADFVSLAEQGYCPIR